VAKLFVVFDHKFQTGNLYSHVEVAYENAGDDLIKIYSKTDPETYGVEVVLVNEGREVSFVFEKNMGKKGSVLEVNALTGGLGLEVSVKGTFEVKLRAGVAATMEQYGSNLDLKIRSLTSKGGSYKGFSSYIMGITDPTDTIDTYLKLLPKINGLIK
jgi:hypothetical protein